MKSRFHRLPPSDPPDDWIDGSWTVDCSCGVTFDDGEEMVSCDECGVWVHTRCFRFVKGQASFACHNCKKNNHNSNYSSNSSKKPSSTKSSPAAADTEETEVAQLLIELPTKAPHSAPPVGRRPDGGPGPCTGSSRGRSVAVSGDFVVGVHFGAVEVCWVCAQEV